MEKLERCGYPMVKDFCRCLFVSTKYTNVTDRETHGQTDTAQTARRRRPRLCIVSRGKNRLDVINISYAIA